MRVDWLQPFLLGTAALPVAATLLSFSRHPHWIFRMWDFPRLQIAAVAALCVAAYVPTFYSGGAVETVVLVAAAAVVCWQLYRVHRYTPLTRPTVLRVSAAEAEDTANRIVMMMTNVLMENDRFDRLLQVVREADPDVVLAVEVDHRWMSALEPLSRDYPFVVRQPQDNYYGMVLFSRLELAGTRIDFLVQEDIPSIHTTAVLHSGVRIALHGVHPRPPEPIRDQPSSPRDAELVLAGRMIAGRPDEPAIVAGDLNDVAWSATSELFVRLSGMLDPRAGRGFFNSYNARNPLLRYPLDHIFITRHFKLRELRRLPSVGSDHFPILADLQYVPTAPREQEKSKRLPGDEAIASEKLQREAEDAATGADRPRE